MPGFIEEFKRRNVFRVGMAYLVITWLVLQVADTAAPLLGLPDWVNSLVLFILALLFIPTLIFAWAFELTPEGIKRQEEVDREQSITGETGRKLDYVTIAALALVLLIFAGERLFFAADEPAIAERAAPGADRQVSIAVLPFADMSPDKDQEYFSDGISEEILNGLAKLQAMKVAGRTSSFAFKGRNTDLREIGAALGVDHVLEGSVRKAGDRLRITAQLVKVSDGFHLWSETYDRELQDIFAVQDEISAAIITELQGSLLETPATGVAADPIDVATFEKYLAARKLIHGRTNEGLTEARTILEEVVEAAPDYAPAISSLAETLVLMRESQFGAYGNLDSELVDELATPLLERAIELDPNLADAYAVLGLMQYDNRLLEEAKANLLHAVRLNPSLSKAWVWLSNTAGLENDIEKRVYYLEKAAAIDPLWLVPNSNFIYVNLDYGRVDEVWTVLERLRPFHQDSPLFHQMDGRARSVVGDLAGAYKALRKAYELSPDTPSNGSQLGFTLIVLQDFEQALAVMPPQFAAARNYLTGEWDDVLPMMRQVVEANPEQILPWIIYTIGANYIGDYEGLLDLYDTHVQSPEWGGYEQEKDMLLNFVPALQALERGAEAQQLLDEFQRRLLAEQETGIDSVEHHYDYAKYLAATGDFPAALDKLDIAMHRGLRVAFWQYEKEFRPVHQDTRFLELQERNLQAINASRIELGWNPVPAVGSFYDPETE
jgi:TolB-like protein/tetratricopeptide (TPR) repeat protein